MQTQRDHVHAQQFLVGRLASALVLGEPASLEVPARRAVFGLIIGVVISVVVMVGFGIFGLLFPGGNKDWQEPGAILLEEETGARYVYLDGELRPALNMASAMLLQDDGDPHIELVSQEALAGVPRGRPVGIVGAPQAVPGPQDLVQGPWLLCLSGSVPGGKAAADGDLPFGINLDSAAAAGPLAPDEAVLVTSPAQEVFLVWRDRLYRIADTSVLVVLGMGEVIPAPAPQRWLDDLESGPVIGAATIEGAGSTGATIGGTPYQVGQLFRHQALNGSEQLFVLKEDGLSPLSGLEYELLAAKGKSGQTVELAAGDIVDAPRSADTSLAGQRLPDLSGVSLQGDADKATCLRQSHTGEESVSGVVLADRADAGIGADGRPEILVPPGGGAVVGPSRPGDGSGAPEKLYLINDQGIKYPVEAESTLHAFGYAAGSHVVVEQELLAEFPTGPVLSTSVPGV